MENILFYIQSPYFIVYAAIVAFVLSIVGITEWFDKIIVRKQNDILHSWKMMNGLKIIKNNEIEKLKSEYKKQKDLFLSQIKKNEWQALEIVSHQQTIEQFTKDRTTWMNAKTEAQKESKLRGDALLKIEDARLYLEKKSDKLLTKLNHANRTIQAMQKRKK